MPLSRRSVLERLVEPETEKSPNAQSDEVVKKPSKKKVIKALNLNKQDRVKSNDVLLTTNQICIMFDVTSMTVWNWRNKKRDPMPTHYLPGAAKAAVRFDEGVVLSWAERNKKAVKSWNYL